jgi:hypothetical protein
MLGGEPAQRQAGPAHATARPGASWRSFRRFLLATIVLAALYIAIQEAWYRAGLWWMYRGWSWSDPTQVHAQAAAEIAARSLEREAGLGAGRARAAFDVGVEHGYLSEWLTRHAGEPKQALVALAGKEISANVERLNAGAEALGLADEPALAPRPARDEYELQQRIEADAAGAARVVEQATSERLRHVFLLGAMAGITLGRLEPSDGVRLWAPADLIGLHGTLGGVPESLWRPLTRVDGISRAAELRRYRIAVEALSRSLATAR